MMTMRSMMMLSDAPGSSGAGTQRAKDGGGEGWRRPEHQEHEDYKYLLFIIYNFLLFIIYYHSLSFIYHDLL